MAIIKCKMCGGDLNLIEGQSVAECEYCGSRQTVPAADNEKKMTLFARANRLRAACEFDKAAGIYEAIVADFPEEAESYWGLVLCKYGIEYVDDPATGKKIPTCHRSSFDSVMDDSNFEQAMENADEVALRVYRQEAKQIEGIRKGILEVSSSEKPYDIFICYKETDSNGNRTVDSLLAQDIYDALTSKGYRVFFSRITLEDKLGQAYEPYIFAALNSAKIMLAVGTCYEHYNAVWVKNEWSRYLKIIAQDKNKYLIPCYKGLDAYDIPKEFAHLQGQDMGKVGAIADLLRGIEKLMPRQNSNTVVVQEKVVVGNAGGSNKIASLLDRGNMALEDGDWAKADSFFEDVLNNDSKNAQAYIGKTLAQEKCRTMDALVRKRRDVYQNVSSEKLHIQEKTAHISEMAEQYSLPGYVEQHTIRELYRFDLSYTSEVSGRQKQYREEESWWQNHRWLSRAEKFAVGGVADTILNEKKHLFVQLADRVKKAQEADARSIARLEAAYDAHILEADQRAEQLYNNGLVRREKDYGNWLEQAKKETNPDTLKKLVQNFAGLGEYKDSRNLAEHCRKRAAEEQAKIDAENERQRMIAEQKRKAQQKQNKKIAVISAAAVVLAIVVALITTKIIIPANNYKEAETLLENGKTAEAAMAFGVMGDYKDARERSFEVWSKTASRETVSADYRHTVGLRNDGTVVAVGWNGKGQCNVYNWRDIVAVSAGTFHTVGLHDDGTVVATGENDRGQCDVANWTDIVAISAGFDHTVGLKTDGTVVAAGECSECNVSDWTDIVDIHANNHCTVGLRSDGTVVTAGRDDSLNKAVNWADMLAIRVGGAHTVGLKTDGTVVATGENDRGQCDVAGWKDIVAISAGSFHTVGLKADGTVVSVGWNEYGQCDVSDWKDIVVISADDNYTVGLKADGTVVAVGKNEDGQCEVSNWTDIKLPMISEKTQAAMATAKQEREAQLAVEKKAEEERLAKKYAAAEKLAENGETAKAAIAFGKLDDYLDASERSKNLWAQVKNTNSIDVGANGHIVALKTNGAVVAVGNNEDGQCDTGAWKDIVSVSAGAGFTVGLKMNGTVIAIGYDDNDRFSVDDWQDIVAVSAGRGHTVGLKADGTVVVAGKETMNGKAIPLTGNWDNIIKVSAGYAFTVGLKSDGTVVSEGYNPDGQCDVEDWTDIVDISAGTYHTVGLKSDGTVVTVGYNQYGECDVRGWKDIVAVSAGKYLTVGLKADGTVVAAGRNHRGQCDVSEWKDIVAIDAGASNTVGIKSDGTVVAIGWDEYGQCNTSDWNNIKLCK